MIAHAVHLNFSDTSHRIPQTATYSFKACLLKFVKIVRVKEIIKFSKSEGDLGLNCICSRSGSPF